MREENGYWVVNFRAYAFDTKAEALAFQDALIDAFCAMPESEGYASSAWTVHESDDTTAAACAGETKETE